MKRGTLSSPREALLEHSLNDSKQPNVVHSQAKAQYNSYETDKNWVGSFGANSFARGALFSLYPLVYSSADADNNQILAYALTAAILVGSLFNSCVSFENIPG